jgi:hypothetical protein
MSKRLRRDRKVSRIKTLIDDIYDYYEVFVASFVILVMIPLEVVHYIIHNHD